MKIRILNINMQPGGTITDYLGKNKVVQKSIYIDFFKNEEYISMGFPFKKLNDWIRDNKRADFNEINLKSRKNIRILKGFITS